MHLSANQREEERRVILEKQKYLEEVLRKKREMEAKALSDSITDQEMVDNIFDFLPDEMTVHDGQVPAGFKV